MKRRNMRSSLWLLPMVLLSAAVQAQSDPRIGEWREGHYAGAVGLYMIYEDMGNGMTRTHNAENLAAHNRLHDETRCDGQFYPRIDAAGVTTDVTSSCTILNARTVKIEMHREASEGWVNAEGKWILSDDGQYATGSFLRTDRDGKVVELVTRSFTRNVENCLNHDDDAKFRECAVRTAPPRPSGANPAFASE